MKEEEKSSKSTGSYDSKKSESKLSAESKLSINERVAQILSLSYSEGCYSNCSSCDSDESGSDQGEGGQSDIEQGEEGQESILSSRHDIMSSIPENRILVKLPGADEEACAPTESNLTDDVPLGGMHGESHVRGFTQKNLRLNRLMLAVSALVLFLGVVVLYIILFVVGVPPSN